MHLQTGRTNQYPKQEAGLAPRSASGLAASYFASLIRSGLVAAPDGATAFSQFYGLLVQDLQLGVLLGGVAPTADFIRARTAWAVAALGWPASWAWGGR